MRHFQNQNEFDKEMKKVKDILERKGFVLESDHPYAYAMQYNKAFEDVKEWLINNGYDGELDSMGCNHKGVDVYCLYDEKQISYEEMYKKLLAVAKSPSQQP